MKAVSLGDFAEDFIFFTCNCQRKPPNIAEALQKFLLACFEVEDRKITAGSSGSVAPYSLPHPVISTLGKLTEIGSTYEIFISTKLSATKPMEEEFDVELDTCALWMGKKSGENGNAGRYTFSSKCSRCNIYIKNI